MEDGSGIDEGLHPHKKMLTCDDNILYVRGGKSQNDTAVTNSEPFEPLLTSCFRISFQHLILLSKHPDQFYDSLDFITLSRF